MMSPTPSHPEDEAAGPGLGVMSPRRSQDSAHDLAGLGDEPPQSGQAAGASAAGGSGSAGRGVSAISDESLLQALYNANSTRG